MWTRILFFVVMFATLIAMFWSGFLLFRNQEDPLGERLVELQNHAMVSSARAPRRKGGGVLNSFLYFISLFPGGEDWLRSTERELAQAGIRRKQSLAWYIFGHLLFLLTALGVMLYFQWGNPFTTQIGRLLAAHTTRWLD